MSGQTFNEALLAEIRAEMARQRVSQRELARMLGWPSTTLNRRLSGRTPLSAENLHQIAATLRVPVSSLGFPLVTAGGRVVR